jgi:hypothetical protein
MSRAPVHICFYSNRCEWSKAFITELAATPYKADFKFICVDPSPNRPQLPSWLKKVPTLVISGEPEPKTDGEVLNWLYERKMKDGTAQSGPNPSASENGPEPFLMTEMGGSYDDSYTFLSEDNTSMSHNFSFLNGGAAGVGTREASTFQTTGTPDKRSKKEQLLDQQYEAFQRDRDAGIPKRIARQ